jgi:hypothetical protein
MFPTDGAGVLNTRPIVHERLASTGDPSSADIERPIVTSARGLVRWLDPEWLLFEGFLLVPALVCLLWGDADRAEFYARLALHAGCLKWLGWSLVTRVSDPQPLRFLMFPVELVVGLTVAILWFYVRNVAGWLVPGSYSLIELGIVPWLVAFGHLFGALLVNRASPSSLVVSWSQTARSLLVRASIYAPFTLTLTLTLLSVAKEIFAPSQDGWFHAFFGRVYLNDGLFYPHFNGGQAIFYVSGFGAINAVTAAISGISIVKVHNLQHIFWVVVGLYMITATVAVVARRPLAFLQFLPLLFLNVYPVHNLPPDQHWIHGAQQLAPSLLIAVPLLSLLLPVRRHAFYTGMAIQAALSLLVLALSPVCAPFLLLACTTALLINCARGRGELGEHILKVASVQAALTVLAALLVLGSDRYYSKLILSPTEASYMEGSNYGGGAATEAKPPFTFSSEQGLATIAAINPFNLIHWPPEESHLMGRHLAWLVFVLTASAGVLAGRRLPTLIAARSLAVGAAASLVGWAVAKYGMSFFAGGITNPGPDAELLYAYLFFLGRRVELWLLFLAAVAAGVSVYLSPRDGRERAIATATVGGAAIVMAAWWLPHASTHLDPRRNYFIPRNQGVSGIVTPDDVELASWMEESLASDHRLVGLTSMPFKFGQTKLLFPIGASQALPLYGKGYSFCFQVYDPCRTYSYDEYTRYVLNYLDTDWLLTNNIRYFHMPNGDLTPNHGLSRALEVGLLQPVRTVSSSGVYEVRPMPWTPRVMSMPSTPASSYQVRWLGDGSGIAEGGDAQLVFRLQEAEFVHAIRFKYTLTNPERVRTLTQLFWKRGEQSFVEHERTARLMLEPNTEEETLTILVHDTLDQFRFDPDIRPGTFRIREIELLIKPD